MTLGLCNINFKIICARKKMMTCFNTNVEIFSWCSVVKEKGSATTTKITPLVGTRTSLHNLCFMRVKKNRMEN